MNKKPLRQNIKICVITLLIPILFSTTEVDADKLVLVGTEGVKNSKYGKYLILVFTEAFGRLGYELQYDGYPAARASAMSDSGEADGEISRVFEYQAAHPNLIRVEEELYSTNFVAFAAKSGIVLQGWNSLKNTDYIVDYRRGVKLSESRLSQVVPPGHLSEVTSAAQGLKKLISGRTDLYVDVEFTILEAKKGLSPNAFDVSALYPAGIMQKVDAFSYLHKKHALLVPQLTKTLKAMKQEGLFDSYLKIALGPP